ncbi:putative sulfate exporter family transporter [Seongchinamella unica]|uniref:Putative sulfate exporter family transporter n=1 Tax=Seongchinamella unica TaxID=2547392 RepID=A0A4R5LU68_9GAMM|nr:putative sulfate exporter family transporter [Seongchinamella unica]TDG14934.1 putative sulfate exporter family transporter [Seongchinamella unica]
MRSFIVEKFARLSAWLPGLVFAMLLGSLALLASQITGVTPYLLAIVGGMCLGRLGRTRLLSTGTAHAATWLLRAGIVLMATRLELAQVAALGWPTICLALLAVIVSGILGFLLARLLGLASESGLLLAGAVSICGASAAIALVSVMDPRKLQRGLLVAVLVCVTALSTLAMFFYPLLAEHLKLDSHQSGILMGASIHDVAQVVGAAYAISPDAGDTAIVTKMLRILLLIPVMLLAGIVTHSGSLQDNPSWRQWVRLPGFIWLFLLVFALSNLGIVPTAVGAVAPGVSSLAFASALAAAGMRVSLHGLLSCGWRPVMVMVAQSLVLLFLSAGVAVLG